MENINPPVPLEEQPSDYKPLEFVKEKKKPDPDIEVKFIYGKNGVVVAVDGDGVKRIVPSTFKVRLVYATKIKQSLWNTYNVWS